MNPSYDTLGKFFVKTYYEQFDQKERRREVSQYYIEQSLLTFEGEQFMGQVPISKKLTEYDCLCNVDYDVLDSFSMATASPLLTNYDFPMGNIYRHITKVDCQPMLDGGVLVYVLGQLKSADSEGDKCMSYSQVFLLKSHNENWFILHDIFRLGVHDFAAQ